MRPCWRRASSPILFSAIRSTPGTPCGWSARRCRGSKDACARPASTATAAACSSFSRWRRSRSASWPRCSRPRARHLSARRGSSTHVRILLPHSSPGQPRGDERRPQLAGHGHIGLRQPRLGLGGVSPGPGEQEDRLRVPEPHPHRVLVHHLRAVEVPELCPRDARVGRVRVSRPRSTCSPSAAGSMHQRGITTRARP